MKMARQQNSYIITQTQLKVHTQKWPFGPLETIYSVMLVIL